MTSRQRFTPDQFVKEDGSLGIVLSSGPLTFDIVWEGGSTSRYRYGARDVMPATDVDLRDNGEIVVADLRREVAAARKERRTGARIKRGQVWPGGAKR